MNSLPINDELDVQLAVRYEDYGGTIEVVDPKLAISWRATDEFSLGRYYGLERQQCS